MTTARAAMDAGKSRAAGASPSRGRQIIEPASIQDWAAALELAAANAITKPEQQALRRAARALFHQPAGRRERFCDAAADRVHIAEAIHLVETGNAASEWAAFMKVAATIPGGSQRSIAERLRRKAARENHPRNPISGK